MLRRRETEAGLSASEVFVHEGDRRLRSAGGVSARA
jgi:hypothetical protein